MYDILKDIITSPYVVSYIFPVVSGIFLAFFTANLIEFRNLRRIVALELRRIRNFEIREGLGRNSPEEWDLWLGHKALTDCLLMLSSLEIAGQVKAARELADIAYQFRKVIYRGLMGSKRVDGKFVHDGRDPNTKTATELVRSMSQNQEECLELEERALSMRPSVLALLELPTIERAVRTCEGPLTAYLKKKSPAWIVWLEKFAPRSDGCADCKRQI